MPYIIFENDYLRDTDELISGLALAHLMSERNFRQVEEVYPKIPKETLSIHKLIALYVELTTKGHKLLLHTKLTLKTDAYLIEAYGDSYLGYIVTKETKADIIRRLTLADQISYFEDLKKSHIPYKKLLKNHRIKGRISDDENDEYISLCELSTRPIIKWLNEKEKPIIDELSAMPALIRRGF